MADGLGFRFQPGLEDTRLNENGATDRQPGQSPQGPVRILSLRVPKQPSITGIAPHALLTSPGGAAPGAQGLDSLIAALIQAFKPQAAAGGAVSGVPQLPGTQIPTLQRPADGSGLGRGPSPQLPTFQPSPAPSPQQEVPLESSPFPVPSVRPGDPNPRTDPEPVDAPIGPYQPLDVTPIEQQTPPRRFRPDYEEDLFPDGKRPLF